MSKSVLKQHQVTPKTFKGPQGRRFDAAQRQRALMMLAGGIAPTEVASTIGTTMASLRRWQVTAKAPTPGVAVTRRQASRKAPTDRARVVKRRSPPPSFVEIRQPATTAHLEVVLRCGIVLRVPESIAAASLRRLVEALEMPC